jgi:hypothetical protein
MSFRNYEFTDKWQNKNYNLLKACVKFSCNAANLNKMNRITV